MALPDAEKRGIVERYEADRASYHAPGIDPGLETVAWLWDQRIAAIAIDTPTFEVLPYEPARGWAHHRLLALLGCRWASSGTWRCWQANARRSDGTISS